MLYVKIFDAHEPERMLFNVEVFRAEPRFLERGEPYAWLVTAGEIEPTLVRLEKEFGESVKVAQ